MVSPQSEADWTAYGDANTLIRAAEINADENRLSKAKAWVDKIVAEREKEFKAAKAVAKKL